VELETGIKKGQAFCESPAARAALERYAMGRAKAHFVAAGWDVTDVSKTKPFDLLCSRDESGELHIEVKGTVSAGTKVLLTRNEVKHAKDHPELAVLFIVSDIELSPDDNGRVVASGGLDKMALPWIIDDSDLTPLAYEYRCS
jgi:hypothetical protein